MDLIWKKRNTNFSIIEINLHKKAGKTLPVHLKISDFLFKEKTKYQLSCSFSVEIFLKSKLLILLLVKYVFPFTFLINFILLLCL